MRRFCREDSDKVDGAPSTVGALGAKLKKVKKDLLSPTTDGVAGGKGAKAGVDRKGGTRRAYRGKESRTSVSTASGRKTKDAGNGRWRVRSLRVIPSDCFSLA